MKVQIAKWGNSAAVRLPKALLEQMGVEAGSEVDMSIDNGVLTITAVETARPSLAELISSMDGVGPDGQADSVDWGPDRGSELIVDEYTTADAPRGKRAF